MRLLLSLLALGACAQPVTEASALMSDSSSVPTSTAPADTSRADAAGLTAAQAADLERLGVPVYVPHLPDGWTLTDASSAAPTYDGGVVYPEYALHYRTPSGACLTLDAASDGLGDVFFQPPPNERNVDVPGVPTAGPALLGWSTRGASDEGWERGRTATEWFGTDGLALRIDTADAGCGAASPDVAAAFIATLRPLDPVATADEIYQSEIDLPSGPDPEAVAMSFFGPEEPGEGRQRTTVETLRRRDRHAVVLVTATDQADDSVRDVRTRVALVKHGSEWQIVSGGRQTRCQPGRGHAEWSAAMCS